MTSLCYNLLNIIGNGGFANVFLARNIKSQEEVAIKRINKQKVEQSNMMNRIENEIWIHKQCKHKNIVQLVETFEDDEYIYMSMQYIPQGNLYQFLHEYGIPQIISYPHTTTTTNISTSPTNNHTLLCLTMKQTHIIILV